MIKITENNIVDYLLDKEMCRRIVENYENDTGSHLTFRNEINEASTKALLPLNQIVSIKTALLKYKDIGKEIFEGFIFNSNFPHEVLFELLEEGRFIHALAHRSEPIDLLLKIARRKDSPSEALLTAGQCYYDAPKISSAVFKSFLEEFSKEEELFVSLAHYIKKRNAKTIIFEEAIKDAKKMVILHEEVLVAQELLISREIPFIVEKYKMQIPRFLRSISKNKYTPIKILENLAVVSNIKYATDIRQSAHRTLSEK